MKNSARLRTLLKMAAMVGLVAGMTAATTCPASDSSQKNKRKTGILLVAFGSSEASAQVSFQNIDGRVRQAFPDIPVRWAYTSRHIRKKLAHQGKKLDSPETALAGMLDEDFTHVAVQSLHVIPGQEYDELRKTLAAFAQIDGFAAMELGAPLMCSQQDMARCADAVLAALPKERRDGEAVVLMGHGAHHHADTAYAALMYQLQTRDPLVFVATVEGYPRIDVIKAQLLAKKVKQAYLMPLMSVAGDHAKNDMAGDEPDSWKSILSQAGIACAPVLKGLAEHDAFVDIWSDHLKTAVARLN